MGDVFQDRRQPRHRDAAASQSNPHQSPLARNQFRQEIPWMTLHSQTAQFGTLLLNVTRSCSVTSAGPHRRPFLAALSPAVPPLGQKAQKGALSLVPNPGPCLCRYRSCLLLAEVPHNGDRNTELKQRLHDLVGQQHTGEQGRAKNIMQPQTEKHRWKRACALTARGSISIAMMATGSAECTGLQP